VSVTAVHPSENREKKKASWRKDLGKIKRRKEKNQRKSKGGALSVGLQQFRKKRSWSNSSGTRQRKGRKKGSGGENNAQVEKKTGESVCWGKKSQEWRKLGDQDSILFWRGENWGGCRGSLRHRESEEKKNGIEKKFLSEIERGKEKVIN